MNVRDTVLVYGKRTGLATVYACPHCTFVVRNPMGMHGAGRGHGFASSSRASAKVVAHIRAQHMDVLLKATP